MNTFIKFFVALLVSIFFFSTPSLIAMDDDPRNRAQDLINDKPRHLHRLFKHAKKSDLAFSVALHFEEVGKRPTALLWYLKIGDAASLFKAAELCEKGVEGRPQRAVALQYYREAYAGGHPRAKKQIAKLLTQWEKDSVHTFMKFLANNPAFITELKDPHTLFNMGHYLEKKSDLRNAFRCYVRGSQLGHIDSAMRASTLLETHFRGLDAHSERAAQFTAHAELLDYWYLRPAKKR